MGTYKVRTGAGHVRRRKMAFTVSIDERPEAWVLTARGDLDYGECPRLRSHTERIVRDRPAAVVADFSGVEYLDSSGLGLLLGLSQEYGATGGRLVLVANETVERILEITRLTGVFTIEADVAEALSLIKKTTPPGGGVVGT